MLPFPRFPLERSFSPISSSSKKTTFGRLWYNFTTLPRPTDLIIPANLASPFAGEIGNRRERKPFPFLLRPSGDVRPPPPLGLTFPPLS